VQICTRPGHDYGAHLRRSETFDRFRVFELFGFTDVCISIFLYIVSLQKVRSELKGPVMTVAPWQSLLFLPPSGHSRVFEPAPTLENEGMFMDVFKQPTELIKEQFTVGPESHVVRHLPFLIANVELYI
jgi:hypothetical protein